MSDSGAQSLFIGGITTDATVDDLSAHLASLNVNSTSIRLFEHADGTSKGCAIVEFASAEDSVAAIASIDNSELQGKIMNAREDRGSRGRQKDQPKNEDPTLIYVGNLDLESTADDLTSFFANYGTVNTVSLHRKRRSEQPQGCWATVQMGSVIDATTALGANGSDFQGATIVVEELKRGPRPKRERKPRRAQDPEEGDNEEGGRRRRQRGMARTAKTRVRKPREKKAPESIAVPNPECFLFVGNLAWDATEDSLCDIFANAGTVTNATIPTSKRSKEGPPRSRGWGTVEMGSGAEAENAVATINGCLFMERELLVRKDTAVVQA